MDRLAPAEIPAIVHGPRRRILVSGHRNGAAPFSERLVDRSGSQLIQSWIDQQNVTAYAMRFVTVMSVAGFALMLLKRESVAWFMVAACVIYPRLYYVVVSDMRYRYPILWLSLLAAGYLVRLLEPSRGPIRQAPAGESRSAKN